MRAAIVSSVLKGAMLACLIAPTALRSQEANDPPGRVKTPYRSHGVTFAYPENWRVLDEKDGDVLIGNPKQESVYFPHSGTEWFQMATHALWFGFYDANADSLEGAADELLGRFHQRFPSLQYLEDEHGKRTEQMAGREWFEVGFTVRFGPRSGVVIVTRYNKLYWYWLFVTPSVDAKEYTPTINAIVNGIQFPTDTTAKSSTSSMTKAGSEAMGPASEIRTPREVAAGALPSIVSIVTQDSKHQPFALGSGFYVRAGIIATNLHVIRGAADGYAKAIGKDDKLTIDGVVGIDASHDLVLLRVSDESTRSLPLGDDKAVEVGDPVFCIGNPVGLEGTFSQGIVSARRKLQQDDFIQITAPISPGSSGGPVLNANGNVVAIAVATVRGGQNLNFAIPVSYLADLIGRRTPLQVLSTVATNPPSAERSLGAANNVGVVGTNFAWESDHTLASEYTLSLRNSLRSPVTRVSYVVIFYDKIGKPIDSDERVYDEIIPAGLAKRTSRAIDNSVWRLTAHVEVRVLDYTVLDE